MQVIVGLLPAGVLGLLFDDYIDEHLFSLNTVLIGLVVGAVLMILADLFGPKRPRVETVDQMSYGQALGIGLFQCIALWPGFSRSGSTISGGVLLGMSHKAAADFTFIMAVPIMAGASGLSLVKTGSISHQMHYRFYCWFYQRLYFCAYIDSLFLKINQPH